MAKLMQMYYMNAFIVPLNIFKQIILELCQFKIAVRAADSSLTVLYSDNFR